jgi:alkylation response protein AidB-like acyl-CoA dehydrogenase
MAMTKSTRSDGRGSSALGEALQAVLRRVVDSSEAINKERQIPEELIRTMASQGLFRLLVPASVGGNEIDYLDYLSMTRAIAEADGSVGWCFNQNNVLGTMASLMPESLAEEVWSDREAILCNGPPQHTTVTLVDGGHTLTGRWNFSSGSRHATWAVAVGRVGEAETRTMFIPKQEVDFIDVWQVNGLRGTGSFSFEVKEMFVPARRSFVEATTPRESGPLYLIPRSLLFASGFASVALGVARSGLDVAIDVALKKTPQEQALLRDQPATQREIGQAEAIWGSAHAFLMEKATRLWTAACDRHALTMEDRIQLRLASTHAIRRAAEVVDLAYSVCGASSIFETSPIQRKFQDAHAITQQIQGRMEHYETAGQFFLGLEPQGRMF